MFVKFMDLMMLWTNIVLFVKVVHPFLFLFLKYVRICIFINIKSRKLQIVELLTYGISVSFSTYQPDFIATYCRLSIFLEHFIAIIGYEKRQCLREGDEKVYADLLEKMVDFQQRLDDIWRSARWISNYASIARDKHNNYSIPLTMILMPPRPALPGDDASDVGYHSDQGSSNRLHEHSPNYNAKVIESTPESSIPKTNGLQKGSRETLSRSKSVSERGELKLKTIDKMFQEENLANLSEKTTPRHTPKRQQSDVTGEGVSKRIQNINSQKSPGIIRVFAAFECPLPKNTAIRLSITPMTTSKEIVSLVIEQINKVSYQCSTLLS